MAWDAEKSRKQKEYKERDPEKWKTYNREYQRRYREENREKIRERERCWYHATKGEKQSYFQRVRRQVLEIWGSQCARCGFSDPRALQIDHINGGGKKEMTKFPSPLAYYKYIIAQQGVGYQLLCANCNQIKKVENKEWASRWKDEE